MINLVTVENPIQEKSAGATVVTTRQPLTPQEIKGKLVEYTWFMRKEGYRPSTIKGRLETIKTLVNAGMGPQLLNPDAIKTFIAQRTTWEDGYKRNVVYAYTTLLTMHGLTWNPPRYKAPDKLPFIPLESELDQLITTTGKRMSIFLQGLKETGADPGELFAIKWIDINPENRTLAINYPVKGHKARILNVSSDYISRLNTLPKKSEQVFQGKIESIRRNFEDQRRNAARKLNNPRLLEINFTTFRHWKATFEYHKTKDPYHVKRLLGHNSLRSTEIYINIEQAVFKDTNDQFHVKVAETLDEACKLLEVGFEYVTDMNCKKLFRKRK
jgi:integrase